MARIERMFDKLDDAAVVDQVTSSAREENAACARRLLAVGELWARHAPADEDERSQWAIDGFENVVAEVSAALRVTRKRAAAQLDYAIGLRLLPKVAEVFGRGEFDFRVLATILSRTSNVDDPEALAAFDAVAAKWVSRWTRLSHSVLVARIDEWVAKFDPAGVRIGGKNSNDRFVRFLTMKSGVTAMFGALSPADAVAADERLDELARTVCAGDGRTHEQRRADAVAAMAAGHERLTCECGSDDCVGALAQKPATQTVVHVLAEQSTLDGGDALGFMAGHGPLQAPAVRELAKTAKLKPLIIPKNAAESGYRPSTALAEFVRWRDMTCRFPGCEHPSEFCDIDHTVPFPVGLTHPSNLKCLCRRHHLLKTFWAGQLGWNDKQLSDGTVVWTSPTGHTYTTTPGGSVFFPALAKPTGPLVIPSQTQPVNPGKGVMMPRRRRTRAQDKQARRDYERRINEERIAEEQRQHQAWLAANDEPPPF